MYLRFHVNIYTIESVQSSSLFNSLREKVHHWEDRATNETVESARRERRSMWWNQIVLECYINSLWAREKREPSESATISRAREIEKRESASVSERFYICTSNGLSMSISNSERVSERECRGILSSQTKMVCVYKKLLHPNLLLFLYIYKHSSATIYTREARNIIIFLSAHLLRLYISIYIWHYA